MLRIQIALLAQETNSHLLDGQCRAHPEAVEDFHLVSHHSQPSRRRRPYGAQLGTPLFRYLGNGLELVELTGGGASGTPPGHGKPRAVRISTPRHGSTCVYFTVGAVARVRRLP